MIGNSGGLINVMSLDGFLDCASVFTKSVAEMSFCFSYILHIAFGTLFVFCRLDYWLTSSHLFDYVNSVDIVSAIKTDHSAITTKIQVLQQEVKGPGFWKLNTSLLLNKDYTEAMEHNISKWSNESSSLFDNQQMSWE